MTLPNDNAQFFNDPEYLEKRLEEVFSNLHYTWDKDLYEFIDKLDAYNWRKTQPPINTIRRYISETNIAEFAKGLNVLEQGLLRLHRYSTSPHWFDQVYLNKGILHQLYSNPIAYFSAEFGLVEWLQIYSGGLGILAGDFLKQSNDMGIPLVGVGIYYHNGYFHQDIDESGMQRENYIPQDPASSLLKLAKTSKGLVAESEVTVIDHPVYVRAWEAKVGRNSLYLLDTNFEKNTDPIDRMITSHLYGGDEDTRIRQEIVLGIGGYRLLTNLGIFPSIFHLNEGHASFVVLAKMLSSQPSKDFDLLFEGAKHNIIFTNHTLNAAGNDRFDYELTRKYLDAYAKQMQFDFNKIFNVGSDQLYSGGKFSMTIMGLKGSEKSNAVSILHGKAASKIWPDYPMEAITNGVHLPTWVAKPFQELFAKYVDYEWYLPTSNPIWNKIYNIPDELLFEKHLELKIKLIEALNSVLGCSLTPSKLTIVWTRRFTAYKRPDIFLHNLEALQALIENKEYPLQFIIGGKAHPRDIKGKELLQKIIEITKMNQFKNKVVYVTGYNWNVARYLVSGADVWLNNPARFEEACGTSGMKAGANGVLQFTTLDGWTDEVDWSDKGWVLPQENINNEIYRIIREEIVPTYYNTDKKDWINKMKRTMKEIVTRYSAQRMLEEYMDIYQNILDT